MNDQAISTLQSIAAKQRTPKINMALAKLYHQSGQERSAITAYKEVLRVCTSYMPVFLSRIRVQIMTCKPIINSFSLS